MKNFANTVVKVINQNKIALISAFLVVAVIGVPAYAHQVRQSNQEKYYKEQQAKLEELKKQETLAVKPADTPAPTPEAKPEDIPAPAPAPAPAPKKTYTATAEKTYTKPPEEKPKPTYVTINFTPVAVQSGAVTNVSISLGTSKAGTCSIFLKDMNYVHVTADMNVVSVNGVCNAIINTSSLPSGSYYVKAYFQANDSSVKGYGYSQINLVN